MGTIMSCFILMQTITRIFPRETVTIIVIRNLSTTITINYRYLILGISSIESLINLRPIIVSITTSTLRYQST